MAGEEGFEPSNGGFKGRCLTTWRLPKTWLSLPESPLLHAQAFFTLPQLMFAIVDIAGFQEKVEKGMKLQVPLHDVDVGKSVKIESVLLISDGDTVTVGAPLVSGASV